MAINVETSSLDNSYSNRSKAKSEEKQKLQPVVKKGAVVVKKEGLFSKFKRAFLSDDSRDIGDYILYDLIIPGIKNAILDTLERAFFSTGGGSRNRSDSYERASYSSFYKSSENKRRSENRRRSERREGIDYKHIILKNRDDADRVCDLLRDSIKEYGTATVASLLELVGEESSWADNDYGWDRERDISIRRVRDGYLIDVPEAVYLN